VRIKGRWGVSAAIEGDQPTNETREVEVAEAKCIVLGIVHNRRQAHVEGMAIKLIQRGSTRTSDSE